MNASTTSDEVKHERGKPIAGRQALNHLDFRTRTTSDAAKARSRQVRRLRLALPLVAIVLVFAFVVNTRSNNVDRTFLEDFKDLSARTDELRMANPRFAGVDENGKPFEITALAAKQDPQKRDVVELEKPRAVQGADDEKTIVTAENGVYMSDENILELSEGVQLEHDIAAGRYILTASAATVSIKDEVVTSDAGIGGTGPEGEALRADRMTAYKADGRVVFEGNVSMRIYPKSSNPAEDQTSAPEEE